VVEVREALRAWLEGHGLAGGAGLKSVMDRMGHTQIQTTQKTSTRSPTLTNATSTPSPRIAETLRSIWPRLVPMRFGLAMARRREGALQTPASFLSGEAIPPTSDPRALRLR
jgi:hypothetical protein